MATASWGGWGNYGGGGGGWNDGGGGGGWNDGGGPSGSSGYQEKEKDEKDEKKKKTKKERKHERPGQLKREYDRAPQLRQIAELEARLSEVRDSLAAEKSANQELRDDNKQLRDTAKDGMFRTIAMPTSLAHPRSQELKNTIENEQRLNRVLDSQNGRLRSDLESFTKRAEAVIKDHSYLTSFLNKQSFLASPCQENRERIGKLEKEASAAQGYKAPMSHDVL